MTTAADDPGFLYRFRPLSRIVDQGELERQEIYFAALDQLNDPMEGFLNLVWSGDRIVWRNLFRQYLLCLEKVLSLLAIGGKQQEISVAHFDVFSGPEDLPTDKYRARFAELCADFFADQQVTALLNFLGDGARRVRRSELLFYFTTIHQWAVKLAIAHQKRNIEGVELAVPERDGRTLLNEEFFSSLRGLDSEELGSGALFEIVSDFAEDGALLASYLAGLSSGDARLAIMNFPRLYLERLECLCYPPWYMACFMTNCSDAAVWGHYGDSHQGVCLKFRTAPNEQGRCGLPLQNAIKGYAAKRDGPTTKIRGELFSPFQKVEYVDTYPEIDFFKSIGRLSWPRIERTWFSDEAGAPSLVAESIRNDMEVWRKRHWSMFRKTCSTKLSAWEYEDEYRLVLSGMLDDLDDAKDRVVQYRFSDLAGVIFGIRTPIDARHKVMKIIDDKCVKEKRSDFKFYQAQYSSTAAGMAIREMTSLKISP